MKIDFSALEEQTVEHFKGGEGILHTRNYTDDRAKIMLSRLEPGASVGYHLHETNGEVMCIISGTGHFRYDDVEEPATPGTVHYCPMGHSHALINDGDTVMEYFAVVS